MITINPDEFVQRCFLVVHHCLPHILETDKKFFICDNALANWHTLNERVKNQDLSEIEPQASSLPEENVTTVPHRITMVPRQSTLVKTLHSHMVSQVINWL